jgi:dihydrodipicolinate synthase/N-acetylneuraminate lyase
VSSHRLSGVLPVIATPFSPDWEIDRDALGGEIDWIFANGAHGLTVAMVSEIQRLSVEEREYLNAATVELAAGRGPVVVSVGAESTVIATRLAAAAARAKASAVMAAPPLLAAVSEAELRSYVRAIADACGLPVILQDASSYVGEAIPAAVQARLILELGAENLLLKPEAPPLGPTISEIAKESAQTARIFDGSGGLALMDTYLRGIVGTMPGPDLVWAVRALWDALEEGDRARALALTTHLSTLISMVPGLDGYVAFEKYMLVKQGVLPSARMRGPVAYELDDVARGLLDDLFAGLLDLVPDTIRVV